VLARARIAPRIARRFDAEDVVLSAYRSFFVRARNGQFSLTHSGDLWRLLVGIMLRKLYHQAAHHTADKRTIDREQPLPAGGDSAWDTFAPAVKAPSAEEAVAMAELVEGFMAQLEPLSRQVIELRLQNYRVTDIAAVTQRSERTVRRILEDLKQRLATLLLEPGDEDGRSPGARRTTRLATTANEGRVSEPGRIDPKSTAEPAIQLTMDDREPASGARPEEFLSDRDFVLQVHLGTGGTGKVYRALQRGSKTPVAVKMLKKASQADRAAVARFLDEARTVARLTHPGIVGIHGIGRTRTGGYFLVQELVTGQNLSQLAEGRRIEVAEAVRWVAEAAEIIDYSHRQGVIHCDLKPANLLLDRQGRLRVTDFGLAQIVTPGAKMRAAVAGTAGYMSPEQLDPAWGKIGPATDIFGLGAVLYALLAGHPPFSGKTVEELLRSILETSPDISLQFHRLDVPAGVDAVCRRSLAVVPRDRFTTAAALAQALLLNV
jgi:DNA-directed RNA polymerase specialized sigma24 family protein